MSRSTRCVVACLVLLPFGPAANAQLPRTDALGDPLPPFAVARLGTTRLRHDSSTTAMAFAPNGKMLAAADLDSVRLWDPATGKLIRHLCEAHFESQTAVAFSPDNKWLAVGGRNGLRVYAAATGKLRTNLLETKLDVRTLHFSPGGDTLVVGTGKAMIVWDVATGKRLLNPKDKFDFQLIATVAPDDQTLLGLSCRNMLSRWRLSDGKLLERWCPTVVEELNVAALSADGKKLALGFVEGTLSLCHLSTKKKYPALEGPPAHASALTFSPDGAFLLALTKTHWYVWRVATGQRLHARLLDSVERPPIAVAPGDGTVACGTSQHIYLFDPVTRSDRFQENRLSAPVQDVFFTPLQGKFAAVTWEGWTRFTISHRPPDAVRFWDAATGKAVGQWPGLVPATREIAVQPKGDLLAVRNEARQISLWNIATGKPAPPLQGKTEPVRDGSRQMTFSSDGTLFAALLDSRWHDPEPWSELCVWEVATGKKVGALAVKSGRTSVFALDSDTLVLLGEEKLLFWNIATGRQRAVRIKGLRPSAWMAWSPDGRLLAIGDAPVSDEMNLLPYLVVRVYEVATGVQVWSFKTEERQSCIHLAFTTDSRTLFGIHNDEVIARHAITGKERGRLSGRNYITSLAMSPDGRRLLTGSDDHTALVWDVPAFLAATLQPSRELRVAELQACWADLAKLDAAVAYRAVDSLVAASAQSIPLLARQMLPVPSLDQMALAKCFAELEARKFAVREQAQATLQKYGDTLVPNLEQRLQQPISLEMRRRLEKLLEQATLETPAPERLRALRALAMLEYVGTPAACKLLGTLADGAPEARLTQEAQAALRRLATPRP